MPIPLIRPAWHHEAACQNYPADWWHADKTTVDQSGHQHTVLRRVRETTARAQRICRQECPVIEQCLEYAMSNPDELGVWGGTTARDRARMMFTPPPPGTLCPAGHDLHRHGRVYIVNHRRQLQCSKCHNKKSREYRARHAAKTAELSGDARQPV